MNSETIDRIVDRKFDTMIGMIEVSDKDIDIINVIRDELKGWLKANL